MLTCKRCNRGFISFRDKDKKLSDIHCVNSQCGIKTQKYSNIKMAIQELLKRDLVNERSEALRTLNYKYSFISR